jgi:hypothetical protein
MAPEGISVVEINLGLPNACYYLYWTSRELAETQTDRRTLLNAIRAAAARLGWRIFALGCNTRVAHLLFQTVDGDVETGITSLLRNSDRHRLYLVQAETALTALAHHIHEQNDGGPYSDPGTEKDLPGIHYGMFMGDHSWADDMLRVLTHRSAEAPSERDGGKALMEIDRANANRHDAIVEAYRSGNYSLKDIAEHFDMHFSEISAVINASTAKVEAK